MRNIEALRIFVLITLIVGVNYGATAQRKANKATKSPAEIQQEVEFYFIEAEKLFILKNYSQATEVLNRCLALDPTNDVVYYKLAEINNETEQFVVAENYIGKALALEKTNKYYYILAVDIYTNLGDLKMAASTYESLIEQVPNTESYLFHLAGVYLFLKDYDKALETYDSAESKFGLSENIAFQRQKIYLQQDRLDEAIAEGKRLIEAYPANERYVLLTAEILSSNGRLDEANTLLTDLIRRSPTFSAARLQLGDIYWKQNNFTEFENELSLAFQDPELVINAKINTIMKYMVYLPHNRLEQSLPALVDTLTTVHPDNANSFLIAGDVYTTLLDKGVVSQNDQTQYREKGAEYYGKYVQLDPSNFNVWQNLLNIELQLDAKDSLAIHAEQALELFPNQAWLYLINGIAKENQKKTKQAIQLLEMGVARAGGNRGLAVVMYGYIGDLYNQLEEYDKSDNAYEKVLELDPLNYTVLNNYSYYLSLRGVKLDQAKKMCSTLIRNNPDNITYLDTYAWVHYNIGEYVEAKRVFDKIMEIGVNEGVYYDHYGDILYKLGYSQEAIENWKKAKELDGSIENINEKISEGKIVQ